VESAQASISLRATGRTRRRLVVNRGAEGIATLAAFLAVGVLGVVTASVLVRGIPALNLDLFTKTEATFGLPGGGIAHALVGTPILVGLATAMALPAGVLVAIFVSEFASESLGRLIRLALDVLNGVPSIVIGVFIYGLIVVGKGQSGWAGSIGLAVVMLPLVSRATMEVLALVPNSLREASFALGVSKWRTVLSVVMPTVLGGILTGTTLAVARGAGETAPLLFTSSIYATNSVGTDPTHALASLPVTIFIYSEAADKTLNDQAWAAAFILMAFVLVSSLTARALLARSERKLRAR
jgi:phosphate transport system permease protein